MGSIQKDRLLELVRSRIETELATLLKAAQTAHEEATHEESKPEDQYDTRGLEASYLAVAQAQRAAELQQLLNTLKYLPLQKFEKADPIAVSALVELACDDVNTWYFIIPGGGGLSVTIEGKKVLVVTPHSPMGDSLLGRKAGDAFEVEARGAAREYEILSVS